ncbi:Por secretion system C-terminal sorting domain-containing protein [Catalinimonas alkaloidigena]|uniref:Por secretion system C-terminal sorting domain-containing protein n=1 Tax=Catalinimonas alkaloidigena TaxID=1075417 RepID=A0A1G9G9J3_9BACT|nr:T9SS type A sorting domain-containing protein [Catalinimonas alkaloidigena]SDK97350.1 Por secretion system C-terminal sorting domain-containing protein [Catalinimonas alkaloidigena]
MGKYAISPLLVLVSLLTVVLSVPGFAQVTKTAAQNGNWHAASTWTPSGMPGDNDVILIPADRVVTVRGTSHTLNNSILIVEGTLNMSNGDFSFGCFCIPYGNLTFTGEDSGVIVEEGGTVNDNTYFEGDNMFIRVQDTNVWSGNGCSSNCGTIQGSFTPTAGRMAAPIDLANPLPVELVSFTATASLQAAVLQWATASEHNNHYFSVERSVDGHAFEAIAEVAGAGSSSQTHRYEFADPEAASLLSPVLYYRLRQVDFDGSFHYSPVVTLQRPTELDRVEVQPNPFRERLMLSLYSPSSAQVQVRLFDARGQEALVQAYALQKGANQLEINAIQQVPAGVYLLEVQGQTWVNRQKVVKF